MTIHLERNPATQRWQAYLFGRSSALLKPVPGNTAPARPYSWMTIGAARRDLQRLFAGCNLVVIAPYGAEEEEKAR